eukprot:175259-Alexandrium_andersonii.AAC.1
MFTIRFGRRLAGSIPSTRSATRFDRYSVYVSSSTSLLLDSFTRPDSGIDFVAGVPSQGLRTSPRRVA